LEPSSSENTQVAAGAFLLRLHRMVRRPAYVPREALCGIGHLGSHPCGAEKPQVEAFLNGVVIAK
jgi:hypothetical protein